MSKPAAAARRSKVIKTAARPVQVRSWHAGKSLAPPSEEVFESLREAVLDEFGAWPVPLHAQVALRQSAASRRLPVSEVLRQLLGVHGSMEAVASMFPNAKPRKVRPVKAGIQHQNILVTATRFKRQSLVQGGAPGLPKRKTLKSS